MIMPDHVPKIEGDPGGRQAFAFAFGYIQALIQLVSQGELIERATGRMTAFPSRIR